MTISTSRQLLLRIVVLAGVCATAAGCASDVGAPDTSGTSQMRYYGGPKSPMWRAPAEN
ncbi:hypothetical protein [Bradyrhizobium tropiciagri]|uniref:hypothetical protein n=1 Tax=Bradyrhizobium tropiciagri TaxID=312253 RepID=UPI000A9364E0|nr:hypothetical protein [Bradyrhizobium tropiciagri]